MHLHCPLWNATAAVLPTVRLCLQQQPVIWHWKLHEKVKCNNSCKAAMKTPDKSSKQNVCNDAQNLVNAGEKCDWHDASHVGPSSQ